jgi:iron complex outermembrane receptor protein
MKNYFIFCIALSILNFNKIKAQKNYTAFTDSTHALSEVIVITKQKLSNKQTKILSSLDSYIESNHAINMIKRGAYAWEAYMNGMPSERSLITIDGMRIYGACTDKMDPISSYVETTNLSKAVLHSGQSGSAYGSTIAGNIDLQKLKPDETKTGFNGNIYLGIETTNMQKIFGSSLQVSNNKMSTLIDITFRDAANYRAGGNIEIPFSQYRKYNTSLTSIYKINQQKQLIASIIFDKATNIGYPALPMDVSLAKAIIGSIEYINNNPFKNIMKWQSKFYYNNVTHFMDDSYRPNVQIKMDMPGYTNTTGFYSTISGKNKKHNWLINLNAHYNYSIAEMTMHSKNSNEKDMYMLTWPGLNTIYGKLYFEDKIRINNNWFSDINIGIAVNSNSIKNELGLNSLRIFYPTLSTSRLQFLHNISGKINYSKNEIKLSIGVGYGERAASISEGFGFYLFNSFDKYDYIGNPFLKKEQALDVSTSVVFTKHHLNIKFQTDFFRIHHYIIATPSAALIPMTIGASGVKTYMQLPYSTIYNFSISSNFKINSLLQVSQKAVYRIGNYKTMNLPQIQPFSYGSTIKYQKKKLSVEMSLEGALKHTKFNKEFGEQGASAYTIFNTAITKLFSMKQQSFSIRAGIENVFDTYYFTFADWNKIPRNGRNIFVNVVYHFK